MQAGTTPPDPVTDFALQSTSNLGEFRATWSSPGDDGAVGALVAGSSYTIQYTTDPAFAGWNDSGSQPAHVQRVVVATASVSPGAVQARTITGLNGGSTYFARLWTSDEAGNVSAVSNAGAAQTLGWASVWTPVAESTKTRSAAWGDYDNDGDLDLLAANYQLQPTRLYRNEGSDVFALAWSPSVNRPTAGIAWGDYDNDGDLDQLWGNFLDPKQVYRNDGGGAFTLAWSSTEEDGTNNVAWGDYDNDGDLDQLVANDAGSLRVYQNNGAGAFTLAWSSPLSEFIRGTAWGDYDNDGDLDVLSGNAAGPHRVYRNDGGGTFTLAWSSSESGNGCRSVAWGDYDNDGDLDFLSGNEGFSNRLYRNTGGSFSIVWSSPELDATRSVAWGDYDNDGDLDQLVGNTGNPSRIYRNDGAATFTLVWSSLEPSGARAAAWADYDDDGDLDFWIGAFDQRSHLYKNNRVEKGLAANAAPPAPAAGLASDVLYAADVEGSTITFKWAPIVDGSFDRDHLYYHVTVATQPTTLSGDGKRLTGPSKFITSWADGSPLFGNAVRPPVRTDWAGDPGVEKHGAKLLARSVLGGATYYWRVQAVDAGLARSVWSAEQSVFVPTFALAPSAASDLAAATGAGEGEVLLTWTSTGDDGTTGDLQPGSFRIFHSTNAADLAGIDPRQQYRVHIATNAGANTAQTYVLGGLPIGATSHIALWIGDEGGNYSAISNVSTAAARRLTPLPPAAFIAAPSPGQVALSWTAPAAPSLAYRLRYDITSSTISAAGPYAALSSVASSSTSYTHAGLSPDTVYYYRIVTVDTGGLVSSTASASATTPDALPPEAVVNLAAAPGDAFGETVLTWTFPGDDGGTRVLLAGSRYAVQHATYSSVSWSTSAAQVVLITTADVAVGALQGATVTGLAQTTTYYLRLWSADRAFNWSSPSNVASTLARQSGPVLASASPADGTPGVAWDAVPAFRFDKPVDRASLASALRFHKRKDRLGNAVQEAVPGTLAPAHDGDAFTFTADAALEGNSLYVLSVSTALRDLQGNALPEAAELRFTTLMDRAAANVFSSQYDDLQGLFAGGGTLEVSLPPNALGADGYIAVGTSALTSSAIRATEKARRNADDPLRFPLSGRLVDLKAYDDAQRVQTAPFASPVTLTMPFTDADGDGVVDGTVPPVRARTLAIHWLDEENATWVRLPTSSVDPLTRRVTARVPHFTLFALIGQTDTDLSGAHPFPVPFKPSEGHTGITFTGLGQNTRIEIFTLMGERVAELLEADGDGQLTWDVRNAAGEGVASGVYHYLLKSGNEKKTGGLVIVR